MKKWVYFSIVFLMMSSLDFPGTMPDVDLEIFGPAVTAPPEPIVGDKVSVVLYIYNYGPDDINGLVKIDWRVNGKNVGQTMIIGLLSEEQKEIKNTFKVKDKINKIQVSIATKMVPYKDNNIDNNVYEEEIIFANLMPEDESKQGRQENIVIDQVDGRSQTGEQGIRRPGSHSVRNPAQSGSSGNGNPSSQGQAGTPTGSATSSNSSKEKGNPSAIGNNSGNTGGNSSDSSNQNASARESNGNSDTPAALTYVDNELNQLFTSYIKSYLILYTKLTETGAKEGNSGRKATLAVLKQDVDTLHTDYIAINKFNIKGTQSDALGLNIGWVALETLLVKIEAGLDAFDEFEPMRDEYIDNSEEYLAKAKQVLGG